MNDEKQEVRAAHFTDTPENTFRTIGMLTPEEMEAQKKRNQEKFDRIQAARQKADAEEAMGK